MVDLISTPGGKKASDFAFGTMQFGAGTPDVDCDAIFSACREAGINVFDTAFGYTDGASERILGRLIAEERDDIVLMTKCAHPAPSNRANLTRQFDESRLRLQQDMVDVLFLHRWDGDTPLEETMETLAGFVQARQVRSIGVSNFSAWQTMKARHVATKFGLTIDVIQPMYNLVKRQAEVEILPMALSESLAVTPYSPLGGGLLTGKYKRGETSGRIVENPEYAARYREGWMADVADALQAFGAEHSQNPISLAVAWVASHPTITAPLISGKSLTQLQPSLDAIGLRMSKDLRDAISALSPTPPPATDRLEEQ